MSRQGSRILIRVQSYCSPVSATAVAQTPARSLRPAAAMTAPGSCPAIRLPALLLTMAMALVVAACGGNGGDAGAGAAPPTVTAAVVEDVLWVDTIEALGTAQANESVTLTAKVTEVVRRLRFEDGDRVEAGDVLVELTGQAEVAQLEEARAALNETQQQLDRMEGLVAQGTIPRAQYDTQRAARDTARARANAIRARLAERVISAPFAGRLGFRAVSDGALVTPGTVITTLDDTSIIKLDFSIPETALSTLSLGQNIRASSAAWPDQVFEGTVTSIGSRVDPVTRAVAVRANLPNPDDLIKPGMLMRVNLLAVPRQTLVLPELSVVQIGASSFVFLIDDDNVIEQVPVELGARRRGQVEVLAGVAQGDRIVVDGTFKVRTGSRVAIVDGAGNPVPDTQTAAR